MEATTTAPNPVAIYNNAIQTFQNGGQILDTNRTTAAKMVQVGQNILSDLQSKGGVVDPETDVLLSTFIVQARQRTKEMEDRRKPVTQMMDAVKKLFTAEEQAADTIVKTMQQYRDSYAKQLAEEQRRREEEARMKANKDKEATDIKAACESQLITHLRNAKEAERTNLHLAFIGTSKSHFPLAGRLN